MRPTPSEVTVVVFDVNVYLDVARLTGSPFTWEAFKRVAEYARLHSDSATIQLVERQRLRSALAVSYAAHGRLAADRDLQVWSSVHIDALILHKAMQPADPSLVTERRGLGWSEADAQDLLVDLHDRVVEQTGGGWMEDTGSDNSPPLSHEDGRVYSAALCAEPDEANVSRRIVVTNDAQFRREGATDRVGVMYPGEWLSFVRAQRRRPPRLG